MSTNAYTLLIVESPTIASIVQKRSPSSVYVLSTDGFCWRPGYEPENDRLKAVANPEKRPIRKELKEQSAAASQIIIATDADPSGDFIAWSLHRFIQRPNIRIGRLKGLNRNDIQAMLEQADQINPTELEIRLKNRFLLHREWSKHAAVPDIQLAALTAIFGTETTFNHFLDENDQIFRSTKPFRCPADEWITVRKYREGNVYRIDKPLSTFDLVESIVRNGLANSYLEAQKSLNDLFQSVLPSSEEALISYPRTDARAFYSDTWEHLEREYLKRGDFSDLKPAYLRDIADSNIPHESVHPLSLFLKPDDVRGEHSKDLSELYQLIYDQTLRAIRMPRPVDEAFVSELSPDIHYFPDQPGEPMDVNSLRPCLTLADIGHRMSELSSIRASRFGRDSDRWVENGWIEIRNGVVTPGPEVLKNLKHAKSLSRMLGEVAEKLDQGALHPETVRAIISS